MQEYASMSAEYLKTLADKFNMMMREGHIEHVLETLKF
jgi:hypothetical protein